MLKITLLALYLLKGLVDFNQTYTGMFLGDGEELIRFW